MILRSEFRAFRKIEKVLRFKAKTKALWAKNAEIRKSRFQNIKISFVSCRVFATFSKPVHSRFCDPSSHFLGIFHTNYSEFREKVAGYVDVSMVY